MSQGQTAHWACIGYPAAELTSAARGRRTPGHRGSRTQGHWDRRTLGHRGPWPGHAAQTLPWCRDATASAFSAAPRPGSCHSASTVPHLSNHPGQSVRVICFFPTLTNTLVHPWEPFWHNQHKIRDKRTTEVLP